MNERSFTAKLNKEAKKRNEMIDDALQAMNKSKNVMYSNLFSSVIKNVILFILLFLDINMYALLIAYLFQFLFITIYQCLVIKQDLSKIHLWFFGKIMIYYT